MEPSHMTVMLINPPPWKDPPSQIMFLFRWTKKTHVVSWQNDKLTVENFPMFYYLEYEIFSVAFYQLIRCCWEEKDADWLISSDQIFKANAVSLCVRS